MAERWVGLLHPQEIGSLFNLQNKGAITEMVAGIKKLNKHFSVANVGWGNLVFIRDRAFWELER
jgi:hypothetical protein